MKHESVYMYSFSYIFLSICLSLVSVSLTNTMTKSNVGEERFHLVYVSSVVVSQWIEGNQGRN